MYQCRRFLMLCGCCSFFLTMAGVVKSQQYQVDFMFNQQINGRPILDSGASSLNDLGQAAVLVALDSQNGPYLPAIYSPASGYQLLGNSTSFRLPWINNAGVVLGNEPNNRAYRYENGVLSYPNLGWVNPTFSGINNAGIGWGRARELTTGSLVATWFDQTNFQSIQFNNQLLTVLGISDNRLEAVQGAVDNLIYLHPLQSNDFFELGTPAGFGSPFSVRVSDGGLITATVQNLLDSKTKYGFWNADGSFDRFMDTPENVTSIRFNDVGQAVGLDNARNVHFYNGSSWNKIVTNDLQGGSIFSLGKLNNQGQFVGFAAGVPNAPPGFIVGYYASPVLAIPEPASCVLLLMGLIVPLSIRRDRHELVK